MRGSALSGFTAWWPNRDWPAGDAGVDAWLWKRLVTWRVPARTAATT